jgi:glutaredoxin-like protein
MLQEIAALSDAISLRTHIFDEAVDERTKFGIERIPATVLRGSLTPSPSPVRGRGEDGSTGSVYTFYGMPGGTEFPGFIESIVDVSRGEILLSEESVKALRKLDEEVSVRVFVTPTCPYCPQMARAVYQLAMVNPEIRVEVIEVGEFPDLGDRYNVRAVPLTVIADRVRIAGVVHETVLVEQLLKAVGSPLSEPPQVGGPTTVVMVERPAERGRKQRSSGLVIP